MAGNGFFKKASDFYVRHLGLMGLLYGLVPIVVVFGTAPLWAPYRPVYWVRLALALLACFIVAPLGFLPPLTGLIDSSNIELAKTALIITWFAVPFAGFLVGALLAAVGRGHISREWPAEEGGR